MLARKGGLTYKIMEPETLIGKVVTNKLGDKFIIKSANHHHLEDISVTLSNGKIYNLLIGYKTGNLILDDSEIIKELDDYIKLEKENRIKREKLLEKIWKKVVERVRKEEEELKKAIKQFRGEYSFLSNFYGCTINYQGYTYKNNEAAFQAQKDLSKCELFTNLSGPKARALGRDSRKIHLRSDWEKVKYQIMEELIKCKFGQNPELKEKLLETGERLLIEGNTWKDTYWGVYKGKGQNNLGKILMNLRKSYQTEK